MVRFLLVRGADVSVRAVVPGHYERPGEFLECNALEYAMRFPESGNRAIALLRAQGGAE